MLGAGIGVSIYTQSTPGWTFSGLIAFIITFFLSCFIGVFINCQIILPILYNLPRSIYLFIKGEVRFAAIPVQFLAPIIWCFGLFIVGFVLQAIAPSVMRLLSTNLGINLGQVMSLVVVLLSVVTPSGLRDLRADYDEKTLATYQRVISSSAPTHYPYRRL